MARKNKWNEQSFIVNDGKWSKARRDTGAGQGTERWHYVGDYKEHLAFPGPLADFLRDPSLLPKRPPTLNARASGKRSHEKD